MSGHRSAMAVGWAVGIGILALLPALASFLLAGAFVAAATAEGAVDVRGLAALVPAVLYLGAGALLVVVLRTRTARASWWWTAAFALVVVAASAPAVAVATAAVSGELCETQPGGRGYAGDLPPEAAPAICRW